MRISDWSSDVCSSDLGPRRRTIGHAEDDRHQQDRDQPDGRHRDPGRFCAIMTRDPDQDETERGQIDKKYPDADRHRIGLLRSEEHKSELQSLMRTSYAVYRLKKKKEKVHTSYAIICLKNKNHHTRNTN